MSVVHDMMFASETLEVRFRDYVSRKTEVGGYLLVEIYHYRSKEDIEIYRATGVENLAIIRSWIAVPNEAQNKVTTYQMFNVEKAREIAFHTAYTMNLYAMHFHSHPNPGTQKLSTNDILFMSHWCKSYTGFSEAALVTSSPLRVINHGIEHTTNSNGDQKFVTKRGSFISWKDKRLREFRGKS